MTLECFCSHCHSEKCSIEKDVGICYAGIRQQNGRLKRDYYCLKKQIPLVQTLLCNNSDDSIRRCCESTSFCNKDEGLLPSDLEAKLWFSNKRRPCRSCKDEELSGQPNRTDLPSIYTPLLDSIPLIFWSSIIFLTILALVHIYAKFKRKQILTERVPNSVKVIGETHLEGSFSKNQLRDSVGTRNDQCNNNFCMQPLLNQSNTVDVIVRDQEPCIILRDEKETHKQAQVRENTSNSPSSDRNYPLPRSSSQTTLNGTFLGLRSISHDIELIDKVGKGSFGTVWRGMYKSRPVAVKIFSPDGESLWKREKDIYLTTLMRHNNILGFIAADSKFENIECRGYWLVTDYYPRGSLRDFIKNFTLSIPTTIRMLHSIANGLDHLHTEILGSQGKPPIAHRDIKSTNILVKCDNTCCIADLGLAVRYISCSTSVEDPSHARVGTCRYLSPEILEDKNVNLDFESLKASDVYAYALVAWEVLRRTRTLCVFRDSYVPDPDPVSEFDSSTLNENSIKSNKHSDQQKSFCPIITDASQFDDSIRSKLYDNEIVDQYQVPYQGLISPEPNFQEMRRLVFEQKVRPPISFRWVKSKPMKQCARLLYECWYDKPDARLTALRVRRRLSEVALTYFKENLDLQ